MKRATITIPDELEDDLDQYMSRHNPAPSFTALVQAALREFLRQDELAIRGFGPPKGRFEIPPAPAHDGPTDVSREHDRYLAESIAARKTRSRDS